MITTYIVFFVSLLIYELRSQCTMENPFYMIDRSCANFNDVCRRKDSSECISLLHACAQCPTTNLTETGPVNRLKVWRDQFSKIAYGLTNRLELSLIPISTHFNLLDGRSNKQNETLNANNKKFEARLNKSAREISKHLALVEKISNKQNKTTYGFEARLNKSESEILEKLALMEKRSTSSTYMGIIIFVICVIGFLVILFILIEMRFQSLKLRSRIAGEPRNYEAIPMTTNPRINKTIHQTLENLENQIKTITKTLSGATAPSEQINGDSLANNSIPLSINMRGFTNTIKIQINREDNVVKVKQKICAQMMNTKLYHFKMMVLKLNGSPLDDNQHLVDKIRSVDDSLYCDVIENLESSDIVVVMLRGNICLPEMIQFNRFRPIEWLKSVLSQLTAVAAENLKLFRDSKEINKLDDLKDYESLCVVEMCTGQINIGSIFDNIKEVLLSYLNVKSAGNIKKKIADSLGSHAENVILFCDNINLDDDVFLFEIDIEEGRQLKFCHLIPWVDINITEHPPHGDFSMIYTYVDSEELVLKKYPLEPMKKLQENKAFLNELITFQITKSHQRFVHLNGVFKEKDYFYISMEKMKGSIKAYIANNHPLSEEIIVKWATQILSALKYLHIRGIIHRNIKPSSILLDKDGNIKLSSFGVAKYVNWGDKKYFMEGFQQLRPGTYRYMAPEVFNSENYGVQADVWSFGATLIEMATGMQPFDGRNESKALMEIRKTKRIPFELDQTRTPEIKEFIDRCLVANPKIRATVDDLLNHDFLHPK